MLASLAPAAPATADDEDAERVKAAREFRQWVAEEEAASRAVAAKMTAAAGGPSDAKAFSSAVAKELARLLAEGDLTHGLVPQQSSSAEAEIAAAELGKSII